MMTDPISDMLARIRNAALVKKPVVELPMSKVKYAIAKILEQEGYVAGVKTFEIGAKPMLRVKLKYEKDGAPAISHMKRISKPGRRIYAKTSDLPNVLSGFGVAIISTSNGLMTNLEARKRRLGGEIICEVY